MNEPNAVVVDQAARAGLPADEVRECLKAEPAGTAEFAADLSSLAGYWLKVAQLVGRLPPPTQRNDAHRGTARLLQEATRRSRARFLHEGRLAIVRPLLGGANT